MHWTYDQFAEDADLEQGDILAPTAALRAVLRGVHPHFCAEKYLGFVIATQSCDLVRRGNGSIKARHVSVAVVRSLKDVLPRLLSELTRPVAPGVFRTSTKLSAKRFLERLFNQNEQSLGLFYLHPDAEVHLGEPCVAVLRVTVALRREHYAVLAGARTGRLKAEFRGKFGWLLGNLYSRAAAPDWSDVAGGKKHLKMMIDQHLREEIPGTGPVWVDDATVEAGKSAGLDFGQPDREQLLDELKRHRPKPSVEQVVDVALHEAAQVLKAEDDRLRIFRNQLLNSSSLRKLLK